MNKTVRDHYPASRLPADLRDGIPEGAEVIVTVEVRENRTHPGFPPEPERKPVTAEELRESLTRFKQSPDFREATDDPVQRIRALRDEWDHR
nr:hypothetical protein [uncultured Gellertiella sp.]